MSFMRNAIVTATISLAFIAPAGAQAPQAEKNVSMKMALMIIEGTLEQCAKDGYKISITIVDKGGNVAASLRGDGTNPHTMDFSRLKAYTARTRGQTSLEFKNLTDKPESAYLKQIPNVVAVGGGVPIKAGNEVIGAVGVSGAPGGEKDEACANAGIAKVADNLSDLSRIAQTAQLGSLSRSSPRMFAFEDKADIPLCRI
ncbi:MAG TPA: heme-binding protein [Pseudolabrys sp.]|nr:heme-binding protein [Pseudolabrys sp.]